MTKRRGTTLVARRRKGGSARSGRECLRPFTSSDFKFYPLVRGLSGTDILKNPGSPNVPAGSWKNWRVVTSRGGSGMEWLVECRVLCAGNHR